MAAEDQADRAKELVPLSQNQHPKGEPGSCSRMSDMLSAAGNSHSSERGLNGVGDILITRVQQWIPQDMLISGLLSNTDSRNVPTLLHPQCCCFSMSTRSCATVLSWFCQVVLPFALVARCLALVARNNSLQLQINLVELAGRKH